MPNSYPVMLRLDGVAVLLVGAGPIAARKLEGLLAAGARVTVVAPTVVDEIRVPGVIVEQRPYRTGEAGAYRLVMTATGIPAVDRQVAQDATAAGVWVNSADDPANCSFTLPAVARRGPVTVAVSTDGHSPALATWLRTRLADALPPNIETAVADLAAQRLAIRAVGGSTEAIDWTGRLEAALARAAAATDSATDERRTPGTPN
jgi:precorrin-2 dehydrogenase / sirohydrochlorin ferrochelatase